jgi:hypothetical protein
MKDSLRAGAYGAAAWGDLDGDGRKDLAYAAQSMQAGQPDFFYVYRNTATGFVKLSQTLLFLSDPALRWADLDNDGMDELLVSGLDAVVAGTGRTMIYKANLAMGIAPVSGNPLPGFSAGSIDVADYNNDGIKDILMTGADASGQDRTIVAKGLGNLSYSVLPAQFAGAHFSEAKWADFNKDGKADFALNGEIGMNVPRPIVYKNMGADSFQAIILPSFAGAGTVDWVDYDGDSYLDLLVTGSSPLDNFASLYRNMQNGTLSQVTTNLPRVGEPCAVSVGDFNKDGKPDFSLAGGMDSFFNGSVIAYGTGTAQFQLDTAYYIPFINCISETADFDNDGYTDLFLGSLLLQNRGAAATTGIVQPLLPASLSVQAFPNPASDFTTIQWHMSQPEAITVRTWNAEGKVVGQHVIHATEGVNTTRVDLAGQAKGTYFIEVSGSSTTGVLKAVIE